MISHFDNIKGWVAIVGNANDDNEPSYIPNGAMLVRQVDSGYNGIPYKVVAKSYPFVVLEDLNGSRHSIDTRVLKITSVSQAYVNALGNRRRKTKYQCPRCGSELVEAIIQGETRLYCKVCRNARNGTGDCVPVG
jgi:DNA-directed RNA polymerase subunit RPC12/RpoP